MRSSKFARGVAALVGLAAATSLGSCDSSSSVTAWSISGAVTGAVSQGVPVALTGASTATATTDATGRYAFAGLAHGSYTVAPSLAGYTFAPGDRSVTVNGSDVTGQDFTAWALPHVIAGTVSGSVRQGVIVVLSGAMGSAAITDSSGAYSFSDLADGAYTVTPSLSGHDFNPADRSVTLSGADASGQDFTTTAAPRSISGTLSGAASQGVNVTLGGASSATTTAEVAGHYAFADLADGFYTVTPSLAGYTFAPASRSVTMSGAGVSGQNFTATTGVRYAISGTISGSVSQGVTVSLGGGAPASTTTDATGRYTFSNCDNRQYSIVPSRAGHAFVPAYRWVTVSGADIDAQDFTAGVLTCPGADVSPPSIPSGVGVHGFFNCSIRITWSESTDDTGVTSYLVYRANYPSPRVILSGTTTSFIDPVGRPPVGTTWSVCYQVSAVDCAGHESTRSEVACGGLSWNCGGP